MRDSPDNPIDGEILEAASRWTALRDRGLSARESVEYELWLAADDRHAEAMSATQTTWGALDRIPEQVGQPIAADLTRRRVFWRRAAPVSLAAAAALIIGLFLWRGVSPSPPSGMVEEKIVKSPHSQTLADGTTVRLNEGGEIRESYTADERLVQVLRGEVYFMVAKDVRRPFVVRASTVRIRALATAFTVNLQSAAVEVIVTEGRVQVSPTGDLPVSGPAEIPVLEAGRRAVVSLKPDSIETAVAVTSLNEAEIAKAVAWQEPLLKMGGAPLSEVAAEFERASGYRLILGDPELARIRIGGRFPRNDLDGFVRMLEEAYGVRSERSGDRTITLRSPAETEPPGR